MDGRDIRTLTAELDSTMRLVRELVREVQLGASPDQVRGRLVDLADHLTRRPDLMALPSLVVRAYAEVLEALGGIRLGRETIQSYQFDRIQKGHHKLSEVNSATESATMELMNGIDRSLALLDQVGAELPAAGPGRSALDLLRHEMNDLFGHLQFQDITAQQLAGVGALLEDIEGRLRAVAVLFNERTPATGDVVADHAGFNGNATFANVEDRQAMIDAAFAVKSPISSSPGPR
jgi:hypothetical protein